MEFPEAVNRIKQRGYATWADDSLPIEFRNRFDPRAIPVNGIRHVRQWGLQVDDEKAIPGHERSSMPDEEIWEVQLLAMDGASYEVSSALLVPAPI